MAHLLGNATKFSHAGSITLSLHRVDAALELSVADTGVGIPPEDLPHIFDEFRQVERQGGEHTEGTGLGLAIAKKTVELLGGFIIDLEGYMVFKNVLTADEVAEMNTFIDSDSSKGRRPSLWAEPFKKLIDHQEILPYLLELIGPNVRLDHDYAIFMDKGDRKGGLHGGEDGGCPGGHEGDHWYKCRDGIMRA